jgi:hypothetical protein
VKCMHVCGACLQSFVHCELLSPVLSWWSFHCVCKLPAPLAAVLWWLDKSFAIWACCTTWHSVLTSSGFTSNILTTLLAFLVLVVVTSKRDPFSQFTLSTGAWALPLFHLSSWAFLLSWMTILLICY